MSEEEVKPGVNYQTAKWNRENQFENLRLRGSEYQTWVRSEVDENYPSNLLSVNHFFSTLVFTQNSALDFVTATGTEFIKAYGLKNKIEPGSGLCWTVINSHPTDIVTITKNIDGVFIFSDPANPNAQITMYPRTCKEFFIEIGDDIGFITIYDLGGTTTVGPPGPAGGTGATGGVGPTGDTGQTGEPGPPGATPNQTPLPAVLFVPPQETTVINSQGSYLIEPNPNPVPYNPQGSCYLTYETQSPQYVLSGDGTQYYVSLPPSLPFNSQNYETQILNNFPMCWQVYLDQFFGGNNQIADGSTFITPISVLGRALTTPIDGAGVIVDSIDFFVDVALPEGNDLSTFLVNVILQNCTFPTTPNTASIPSPTTIQNNLTSNTFYEIDGFFGPATVTLTNPLGYNTAYWDQETLNGPNAVPIYNTQFTGGRIRASLVTPLQLSANGNNFIVAHLVISPMVPPSSPPPSIPMVIGYRGLQVNGTYQYIS